MRFNPRKWFEVVTSKTGFVLSVLNGLGAGVSVFYSYLSAFPEKTVSVPVGVAMGVKTVFINTFISYQVFQKNDQKKDEKDSGQVTERTSLDNERLLINTKSSNAFIVCAILSMTVDLVTNALATYQQFKLLGEKADTGMPIEGQEIIAISFATFAAIRSFQFSGTFALQIWDRMRVTDPKDRFYNHCIQPLFFSCPRARIGVENTTDRSQIFMVPPHVHGSRYN